METQDLINTLTKIINEQSIKDHLPLHMLLIYCRDKLEEQEKIIYEMSQNIT